MRHYLKHNARSETPSNMLFVACDTEAKQTSSSTVQHTLRAFNARHVRLEKGAERSQRTFDASTALDFWRTVGECQIKGKPLWIVAFNAIHTFTLLELWTELDEERLAIKADKDNPKTPWYKGKRPFAGMLSIDGMPFIMKATSPRGTIWLIDTLNYWYMSIGDMAEMVGYSDPELEALAGPGESVDANHCVRSYVIQKAFIRLIQNWKSADLGNWKPTAASLSMASFRHLVCDARQPTIKGIERFNILCDTQHPSVPLEREAYRGGRVEAFYIGKIGYPFNPYKRDGTIHTTYIHGPIYMLDIKSMYPRIMREKMYPCERIGSLSPSTPIDMMSILRTHEAVAEVRINSWHDTYPTNYEGRQVHARGRFWTVLCADELRRALYSGHVEEVGQVQWYATAPLFYQWADYLMDLRTQYTIKGNKGMSDLCKLIANSLHGKFAQRPRKWQPDDEAPIRRRWGRWYVTDDNGGEVSVFRGVAGNVQKQVAGEEPDGTFPAISACIASNAREWLRTLICVCPPRSVLYVATDALIVTQHGYDALTSRSNIRIVGKDRLAIKGQAEDGEIYGQGHYRLGDTTTVSGPFANAVPTGAGTYSTQLWSQAASVIENGPNATVVATSTDWCEPKGEAKGILGADGWIEPYSLIPTPEVFQLTPQEQRMLFARSGIDTTGRQKVHHEQAHSEGN